MLLAFKPFNLNIYLYYTISRHGFYRLFYLFLYFTCKLGDNRSVLDYERDIYYKFLSAYNSLHAFSHVLFTKQFTYIKTAVKSVTRPTIEVMTFSLIFSSSPFSKVSLIPIFSSIFLLINLPPNSKILYSSLIIQL